MTNLQSLLQCGRWIQCGGLTLQPVLTGIAAFADAARAAAAARGACGSSCCGCVACGMRRESGHVHALRTRLPDNEQGAPYDASLLAL